MKQPVDERFACLARVEASIDDLHRARLWTGIQSRLAERPPRRRPWRLPLVLVSGCAAVVLLLVLARVLLHTSAAPSAMKGGAGKPSIQASAQASAAPVEVSTAVIAPYLVAGTASVEYLEGRRSRLEVPAGGLVRAEIGRGARVALVGPAAIGVVRNDDSGLTVSVERGVFLCDYDHRSGRTLRILSPETETLVTGTLFAIEVRGHGTRVSVARGSVSVTRDRQTVRVASGRALSSESPTDRPLEAATAALLAQHDVSIRPASGSAGVLSLSADARAGSAWIDDHLLGDPPVTARLPSGRAHIAFAPAATAKPTPRGPTLRGPAQVIDTVVLPGKSTVALAGTPEASGRGREQIRRDPAPPEAPGPSRAVAHVEEDRLRDEPPSETPSLTYQEAERKMRDRDLGGAKRVLQSLVQKFPQDPLANTARYELARAAFADQDLEAARRHLDELSTRPLATSLVEPAQYLRCRLEVASKRRGPAIACLTTLLGQSPKSPHAAQALAWLASYRLEEGCSLALPYLNEYLRVYPQGAFAAVARQRRNECEQ